MKKYFTFIIFPLLLACNDIEDCQLDPYVDFAGIQFNYVTPPAGTQSFIFNAVEMDGLGFFADNDSLNDPNEFKTNGNIYLPVRVDADSSTFRFYTDSINYYLTIGYRRQAYIFDVHCSAGLKIDQLSIIDTNLDSVRIFDTILKTSSLDNIKIYF